MMQATPSYTQMSRNELISALKAHDQTLHEMFQIIHMPNTSVAPGEKLFLIGARCVLRNELRNEQNLKRLPYGAIAEFIGMSESTASRHGNNLMERFEAKKEIVPYVTRKGQNCNLVFIDENDSVWREPWNIDIPEEKKRPINGNGKLCEHCRTYNLQERTHRITYQKVQECDCCGYRSVSRIYEDSKALTVGEFLPEKKGLQAGEPFGSREGDEQEPLEEKRLEKLHPLPLPSTSPAVQVLSSQDPQKGLQAGEPFWDEAAQLLLEIAGPGPKAEHIEMCKRGPEKYTTIHRQLHTGDVLAHLRGQLTKGATLQQPFGLTRALCFDADTPEGYQRLKEAAQLLAVVGFLPILEPSPVLDGDHVGGGHLWIIFDALVDAFSARQTVYNFTGDLLQALKEFWPQGGLRVRLPGGKYVKQGFEAWCRLYDENGLELSSDGAGAASVLLQRQTTKEVVSAYTKAVPALELQVQRIQPASARQGYLEKDLARHVIAEFNALHSWEAILGTPNRSGKYLAVWRGDQTPNVAINPRTDLAKDFARSDETAMDKYEVYCRIEAARSGEDWKMLKKRDLEQRCSQLRKQEQEQSA